MSLTGEQRDFLLKNTVFSDAQINHLIKRFKALLPRGHANRGGAEDSEYSEEIAREQLTFVPEFTSNPFIEAAGRLYSRG